jgi:hypothetical protein
MFRIFWARLSFLCRPELIFVFRTGFLRKHSETKGSILGNDNLERAMRDLRTRLAVLLLATLCLLTSAYAQITPSADAYTNTADPTTNYGANVLLYVDGATEIGYIQFNLSSIPTGASISQATLKLYVNAVTTAGSFNVDYVSGTWSESKITHSLAPALGTAIVSSVPLTTASKNQYILINITPAVQAWLNGSVANDGIALVANSTFNASFDSKENTTTSHPAELDIVFAGGGGSGITGITTASGSGLIGGGTSGTLNLSLTNTCASGQILEWNGTAWVCAAVGTGTITGVTAGKDLTGGGTSGNVTLNLNTANVPLLSAANTFTANQTVTGVIAGGTASGSTAGVLGESNAATGTTYGVGGYASSPSGYGVEGLNLASGGIGVYGYDSAGTGVYGSGGTTGVSASGTNYGVNATATASGSTGVYGTAPQFGVYGVATASGSTVGVYGVYGTSADVGVYGNSDNIGVEGSNPNGFGYGVYGNSIESIGVYAVSIDGTGVYAVSSDGLGVYANSASEGALTAENNDSTGDYPTMVVQNDTTETHNPVFETSSPNTYSGSRHCIIDTSANLTCTGVVSGVVLVDGGKQKAVYAMQSAENWFEDAGSGQLSNGSSRIELDPAFAQTVNTGVEYHVFLTPKGDSEGLYVSNETPQGFDVHEQRGGHSSIAFDYRIMAKRVGYENVRLSDLTEQFNKQEAPRQKMWHPVRPPAPPRSGVVTPVPQLKAAARPGTAQTK